MSEIPPIPNFQVPTPIPTLKANSIPIPTPICPYFTHKSQDPPSYMATADQDFTFPIFTDPFSSCTIDSPPLWCLSPAASPDPYHEDDQTSKESSTDGEDDDQSDREDEDVFKDCFPTETIKYLAQRKSFSSVEELQGAAASKLLVRRNGSRTDKEEKMDMLWEDFNTNEETLTRSHSSSRFDSGTVNVGCVEALRLSSSKPNGTTATAIFSPRKPGLVVFMKVLKRFFLLHNSHRSVKHHHHHTSYRPSVKGHNRSHKKSVKIGSW